MPLVSRLPVPRAPQLGSSAQPRLIVRFAHATTSNESESPVPSLLRLDTTSTRADSLHPVFTVGASFSLARWLPLDTVGARHLVLLLGASFALPRWLPLDTVGARHLVLLLGASFALPRWLPLDTAGARHLVLLLGASFALPSCRRLEDLTQVNTGELHLMIARVTKLLIDPCSGDPAD